MNEAAPAPAPVAATATHSPKNQNHVKLDRKGFIELDQFIKNWTKINLFESVEIGQ